MEQISKEPEGNHKSSDQTPPVVSDASSQASQESSVKSNGSNSEVFFPVARLTNSESKGFHDTAQLMVERSNDASIQTFQESNASKESDSEFLRDAASGETSQESNGIIEVSDDNTDDGSYIENDDDDNWSYDYDYFAHDSSPHTYRDPHYPLERDSSSYNHQDRHSEESGGREYSFQGLYVCYPLSTVGKLHLENGNQIIMPPSVLQRQLDFEIEFPMLFEIRKNQLDGRLSHCGVSEFTAEEGKVHLPKWMMENLELKEGDFVNIKSVNLENGTYVKIQPHSTDFFSISNPKAALEEGLTNNFFCLTTGDIIKIDFGGKSFYINIVDTKPSSAISIINTDCEVDFDLPLDYKESEKPAPPAKEEKAVEEQPKFVPFTGMARRLNETCSIEAGLLSSTLKESTRTGAAGISVDESVSKSFIYTDCEAYFDQPLDYKEPKRPAQPVKEERAADEVKPKFVFAGVARPLGGACSIEADLSSTQKEKPRRYTAAISVGNSMSKGITKEQTETETSKKESFQPFTGKKYSLRG